MDDEAPKEAGTKAAAKVKSGNRKTISPDAYVEKIDEAKIAKALEFLKAERAKASKGKLDEALGIGDYLYAEFFQRSPNAYTDKGRNSPSLRALMDNPDFKGLGLSRSTVANYITVTIQRDRFEFHILKGKLPPAVRGIGFTQRVRLAACKKVTDELRIATQAAAEGLSPNEVDARVREANAGKPGAARPAESAVILGVKALYRHVAALTKHDLDAASNEGLAALNFFGVRSALALKELAAHAKGELASRPGARAPTAMDDLGAETPDELDALMQAVTGEDLGLGPALRRDTTKMIQGLGAEIVANLEHADPTAAKDWLAAFVAAASAKLGLLPQNQKPARRSGSGTPRAWYMVCAHNTIPDTPWDFEAFLDQVHNPRKTWKCIVQANDDADAVHRFSEQARGLDPDVDAPGRTISAEPLAEMLRPTKTSVKQYLGLPVPQRRPTLDEYIKDLKPA